MQKITIPLWDEGGHQHLTNVTIRGSKANIDLIAKAAQSVKFIVDGKDPDRTASEFIRQHFDEEVWRRAL